MGRTHTPHTGAPVGSSAEPDPYQSALAYATAEGTRAGQDAAGWYVQETIGGRAYDATLTATRILRGIDDGDPAVLDTLPTADLSGEWADTLTGPALVSDALAAADIADDGRETSDWFQDICDAYETAFSAAAESDIAAACRSVLA